MHHAKMPVGILLSLVTVAGDNFINFDASTSFKMILFN